MSDFKPLDQLLTELEPSTSLQFHAVKESTPPTLPLSVRTTWFRILDERIQRGEIKSISPVGFAVYAVIKSFSQIDTGIACVSHETIGRLTGLSRSTVIRAVQALMKHQWIRDADAEAPASRHGRTKRYVVIERLQARAADTGEVVGEVVWTNIPRLQRTTESALKEFCQTGDLPVRIAYHRHLRITEVEEAYMVTHSPRPTRNR